MVRQVVVQVGESDFVLCPDRLSDYDLVDVIELIPVFIPAGERHGSAKTKDPPASILTSNFSKTKLPFEQLQETCSKRKMEK